MTDPTAWPNPDRPGVPLNPERDGWHWVSRPMHGVLPMQWLEIAGGGWAGDTICILASEAARMNWRYLGPCLTPAEVAAAVQAEREACLTIVGNVYPVTNGATSEWRKVRDAIRARGDTSALAAALQAARDQGRIEGATAAAAELEAAVEAARREEREACAALCERDAALLRQDLDFDTARGVAHAAAAIRAAAGEAGE